jgi:hypothetical protein
MGFQQALPEMIVHNRRTEMICREYEVVVVGAIWAEVSAVAEEEKPSLDAEATKKSRGRGDNHGKLNRRTRLQLGETAANILLAYMTQRSERVGKANSAQQVMEDNCE